MNEESNGLLTIIPAQPDKESGMTLTTGTKVLLDGKEVKGVTKVTLTANAQDVWRATIEGIPNVQVMKGMWVELIDERPISWWRRILLRLAGAAIDTTDLSNRKSRTYETP